MYGSSPCDRWTKTLLHLGQLDALRCVCAQGGKGVDQQQHIALKYIVCVCFYIYIYRYIYTHTYIHSVFERVYGILKGVYVHRPGRSYICMHYSSCIRAYVFLVGMLALMRRQRPMVETAESKQQLEVIKRSLF